MANSDKNILITPNISAASGVYPTIKFNGANNTPINLSVLDDGTISFSSTAGQLFSISDGLTGTIFSVNDISGIPSIEVLDTGLVKINQYGGSTVFGSSAAIQNASSVNAKVSISTVSATTPGLIIKAVSSQTANLQEWQDSNGTTKAYMSPTFAGVFQQVGIVGLISGARLGVINGGATENAIVARGAASQTADLQQWQNSAGTVLARVLYNGNIESPIVSAGSLYAQTGDLSVAYGGYFGGGVGGNYIGAAVSVIPWTTTTIGVIVRGRASQSADLQQWQRDDGFVLLKVSSAGDITAGPGSSTAIRFRYFDGISITGTYWDTVETNSATFIGRSTTATTMVVRAATSQTADLQQWQDNAGTVLAKIMSNGSLFVNSTGTSNDSITIQRASTTRFKVDPYGNVFATALTAGDVVNAISGTTAGIYTGTASNIGLIIKAASSQTGDLQQWQNSAGTVLSRVGSSGEISTNNLLSQQGGLTCIVLGVQRNVGLATNNPNFGSGQQVVFIGNSGSVPTLDPTGGGILYVENGALKYRGSSGTVTTIANA